MYLFLLPALLFSILIGDPKSPTDFLWKNRILVIQSSGADSTWFHKELAQGLKDRKLLIVQFKGNDLLKSNYEGMIDSPKFLERLDGKRKTDSHWVLIGLDGGVKKSGDSFPKAEEIFKTIDAMPMRQSEIRRN